MKTRSLVIGVIALVTAASGRAHAGFEVGADIFGAKMVGDDTDSFGVGLGFAGRLGFKLPVPIVDLTPEVVGGFVRFGYGPLPIVYPLVYTMEDGSLSFVRLLIGGRASVGSGIKAFACGHAGLVRSAFSAQGLAFGGNQTTGDISASAMSLAADVGGGVDMTALPTLTIGVHAGYAYQRLDRLEGSASGQTFTLAIRNGSIRWVELGAHASIAF